MTSKDVIDYLENIGIEKLYKKFDKHFNIVDKWSDEFCRGSLLDEFELSCALDQLTGVYMRFNVIANAIDSYKTNKELSFIENAFSDTTKKLNVSAIKESARASTKELRKYRGDFLNYANSAEKGIITAQSRLKRLTVEKGAKGVDFTGDVNEAEQRKQNNNSW